MVIAVVIVVCLAAVTGLILYIRRTAVQGSELRVTQAALDAAEKRRIEQERLDKEAADKRVEEFDAKAGNVTTAPAAIDLLRSATSRINAD